MPIIPTREQARELEAAYAGNPVIDELETVLRGRGATGPDSAAHILQELLLGELLAVTRRERDAVLARFVLVDDEGGAQ